MRYKLLVLTLCGVLSPIVVALAAYDAITVLHRKTTALVASSTVLSNQRERDRMYDDLRVDLCTLVTRSSKTEREILRSKVALDANRFRAALAGNSTPEPLDPEVRSAQREVSPALETFTAEAEALADLAVADPKGAIGALPHFEQTFQLLDSRLAGVNRLILSQQAAAERDSIQTVGRIKKIILAVVPVACFGLGVAVWFIRRSIWGRLTVGMQTI